MRYNSCFFIGHREAPESLAETLAEAIERHITELGVLEFIVGGYGAFDRMTARQLAAAKERHPEINIMLLTPYHPSERKVYLPKGFEVSFYPPGMERVPKRLAIVRANRYMIEHSDYLIAYVWHPASNASSVNLDKAKKALQKNEVRIAELDTIIKRLYEDNILGKISDERFAKMSAEYEREQTSIEKEVLELRETISASESKVVDIERFLKTVRRYTAPSELTPMLVRELVDKIIVHAPDKSSGHRVQRIDIHYKFIGEIELSPEYSKYIKKTTA